MTVSKNALKTVQSGDGSVTSFPFTFQISKLADVAVYIINSLGNTTKLSSGYQVTLNDPSDLTAGGYVTYPYPTTGTKLASDEKIVIIRHSDFLQATDFTNTGSFLVENIENVADKVVMQNQELEERVKRILTANPGVEGADYTLPAPVAEEVIGWNESGSGLVNYPNPVAPTTYQLKYNTISDLKAAIPPTGNYLAWVEGYNSAGDGGGGSFYYDTSSGASDNGGSIIIPDSAPSVGRWIKVINGVINVKWFGAVGDGTTDDTEAIQNAIDSLNEHQTLKAVGVFLVTKRVNIRKDNTTYDFSQATIIGPESGTSTGDLIVVYDEIDIDHTIINVEIYGCRFQLNNTVDNAIALTGKANNITIRNISGDMTNGQRLIAIEPTHADDLIQNININNVYCYDGVNCFSVNTTNGGTVQNINIDNIISISTEVIIHITASGIGAIITGVNISNVIGRDNKAVFEANDWSGMFDNIICLDTTYLGLNLQRATNVYGKNIIIDSEVTKTASGGPIIVKNSTNINLDFYVNGNWYYGMLSEVNSGCRFNGKIVGTFDTHAIFTQNTQTNNIYDIIVDTTSSIINTHKATEVYNIITFDSNNKPEYDRRGTEGKIMFGTAAPTSGTFAAGDKVLNTSPTANGYFGWICTSAGTPGTWKGVGIIGLAQAAADANDSITPSATYVRSEVTAIVTELHDLKDKLRTAGIIASS